MVALRISVLLSAANAPSQLNSAYPELIIAQSWWMTKSKERAIWPMTSVAKPQKGGAPNTSREVATGCLLCIVSDTCNYEQADS